MKGKLIGKTHATRIRSSFALSEGGGFDEGGGNIGGFDQHSEITAGGDHAQTCGEKCSETYARVVADAAVGKCCAESSVSCRGKT